MDKDLIKLLPQKAFKLLSIRESLKIGEKITRSRFDKDSYEKQFQARLKSWQFSTIQIVKELPLSHKSISTKEDGENVLKIYFSQFFENDIAVHIDLRKSSFSSSDSFYWVPSKFHYHFKSSFLDGVCSLYKGFYFENNTEFERGLLLLGIMRDSMNEIQKKEVKDLFYKHFGEGKVESVKFSLKKLQDSFNIIFSYFLKEDIPLNPEFAVLGINLVTLYLTLQDIPYELNVRDVFYQVAQNYHPPKDSNEVS
jgi:hypothetical protein